MATQMVTLTPYGAAPTEPPAELAMLEEAARTWMNWSA